MPNHRTLSWSAALRDLKADRAARPAVREEGLHATAGLRSDPPVALSAWRGVSGRRYVVRVVGLTLDAVEAAQDAVAIAVMRDTQGVASVVAAATALTRPATIEWLCQAHRAGASELHVHGLAETDAARTAVVANLTEF